jgi:hypothetical protein
MLSIDGQVSINVSVKTRITIRRAAVQFQLVKVLGHSYYHTLRDRLSWGVTANYRKENSRSLPQGGENEPKP